jgi:hypothetical protein
MTNEQLNKLKPFIKFKNIFEIMPEHIDNWPEKLSGKKIRGIPRSFSVTELEYIEVALCNIARGIIDNQFISE